MSSLSRTLLRWVALPAIMAALPFASAAPVTSHPRLLMRESDLPALRARMNANNDVWVAYKTQIVDKALLIWKCSSTAEYRLVDSGTPNDPSDDYHAWVRTSFTDENGVLHKEGDANWVSGGWSNQAEHPAAPEDDHGEPTGNVPMFSEQYAMTFALMARLLKDQAGHEAERAQYLAAAKECLFKVIDQSSLGTADGQPFRQPGFATDDRSFAAESFPFAVDWIYEDLTPLELAKVRKAFLEWTEQCNAHVYFAPHRVNGQHGPANSPALLRYDDPDEAARHSEVRLALNNHWANHLRELGLYALALDPKDDIPAAQVPQANGIVNDTAPAGSVTSQLVGPGGVNDWVPVDYGVLRDTTGVWLYLTDYALRHDGAGGISVEGTQYASNGLGPVALLMSALHTAGQDDPAVWGPQVSLANHPFWSKTIPAYLSMLAPTPRVNSDPNYNYLGPVFQPPLSGDLETYAYVNDQFIKVLAPMAFYEADVNGPAAPIAQAVRYIERNLAQGGAANFTNRIRDGIPSKHMRDSIYYFMLFDPTAPTAVDPRPALQPASFYAQHTVNGKEMGMLIARSGQTPADTLFHFRTDWARIDHQRGDSLAFGLWKNGLWLTKVMTGYGVLQGCSDYRNSLGLQNGTPAGNQSPVGENIAAAHGSQWFYSPYDDPAILARSIAGDFIYFSADATPLYNHHAYDNLREIEHASRSIVWLKPDRVVVYDRARSKQAGYYKKFWLNLPDTQASSTVTGHTVHSTAKEGAVAKAELFVTALLPAGAVPQITDISSGEPAGGEDMRSRMFTEAPGAPQETRFLHVVEGANAGVASATASQLVTSSDGAFEGAVTGDTLVLFRKDLASSGQSFAFAAPAGVAKFYLTGLAPSSGYNVSGVAGGTITVSPGSQAFSDDGGVLVFGASASSTVAITATDAIGSENAGDTLTFTLTRSGDVSAVLSVNIGYAGAASAADFASLPTSITFAAGSSTATLTLTPVDDVSYEGTEDVIVKLAPGAGYQVNAAGAEATGSVFDNDAPPGGTLSFSAPTYSALENGGAFLVSVVRTGGTAGVASVKVTATPGTASTADFTAPPATLTWADGESGAKTFTVTPLDDATYEGDETLTLALASPTGQSGLGSPAVATMTIVDNDPAPPGNFTLSGSPANGTIAENGGSVSFTIARVGGKGGAVSVQVATINGSAVGGSDFTVIAPTTLTWADGDTAAKTLNVAIADDSLYEGASESFSFALSNPTGGAQISGAASATITITDDDPPPAEFHVGPGQVYATLADVPWQVVGAGSTVYVHYRPQPYATKLLLSNRGTSDAWIKLLGVAGPNGERPIIDGDNSAIAPGSLPFSGDSDIEDQSLIAVARDNNKPAGFKPGYIEIRGFELRHAAPAYAYTRQSGAADNFSSYGGAINLYGAEHVRIGDCDIHDNAAGILSNEGGSSEASTVRDVVIENCRLHDNGAAGQYYGYNIKLHAAGVTLQFNRIDSPLSGTNVANVRLVGSGLVVRDNFIDGGASQLELTEAYGNLPVLAAEPDFAVTQVYGNVLRNTLSGSGNVVHFGGEEIPGARTLYFHHNTVIVANGYSRNVVNVHGAAETAIATNNLVRYTALTELYLGSGAGTVQLGKTLAVPSFIAGAHTSGAANVVTAAAAGFADEAAQDYHLVAGSVAIDAAAALPAGALVVDKEYVATASAKLRVLSGAVADLGAFELAVPVNGGALQFAAAAFSAGEGDGVATITVTRSGGSDGAVSVHYTATAGTATSPADFAATSGTLNWADGESGAKTFPVALVSDGLYEGNETVALALDQATGNAKLGATSAATLTIVDDDPPPPVGSVQFSAPAVSVAENAGTVQLAVTRTGGSAGAISVSYATVVGSATVGSDFVAKSGTVSWADGDVAAKTIAIAIVNDTANEPSETFSVALSSPTGGASLGATTTESVTITDDDPVGTAQFASTTATVTESAGTVQFTVSRVGGSAGAASVTYSTMAGTAVAGSDFTATSGTLTWADGDAADKVITVAILNDTTHEETEAFTVLLTSAAGVSLGSSTATVTITDDDAAPPSNEYHVGPGQPLASLAQVPWTTLTAGAKVYVHWSPTAYKQKVLISGRGTPDQPILVEGVAGPNGDLPVIDGTGAVASAASKYTPYFGDVMERSIIGIARNSTQASSFKPGYIVISGLELTMTGPKTPMPTYTKTDGTTASYYSSGGAIYIYGGEHVVIRDCMIHDTPNGIVTACESAESSVSRDITVEHCLLYNAGKGGQYNGNNLMTEGVGLTLQFNRLGRGLNPNDNANINDHSAGTVIRYNWIEGGAKLVDLIEPNGSPTIVSSDPSFAVSHVYGNVLVNGKGDSGTDGSNLVRYGGYYGSQSVFRKGTLHFHHNTVVVDSTRWQTNVFDVSLAASTVLVNNNVIHHAKFSANGGPFTLISSGRAITLGRNWIRTGYTVNGTATGGTALVLTGTTPGFMNLAGQDFHPAAGSALIDAAQTLPAGALPVDFQYVPEGDGAPRAVLGAAADLGAFEGSN